MKVYIHTNNKQLIGAKVAQQLWNDLGVHDVEIINVDNDLDFSILWGANYLRGGRKEKFDQQDVQSFTLSRFVPETICDTNYIVTDPDVFPTSLDTVSKVRKLMDSSWDGLYAVPSQLGHNSSVMIRSGKRNAMWDYKEILSGIVKKEIDYNNIMLLRFIAPRVREISDVYNSFDRLDEETLLLHNTRRITQPWKEGLRIDFINHKQGLLRRFKSKIKPEFYKRHPDANQIKFFFKGLKRALDSGLVSERDVKDAIANKYVRADSLELINS